MEISRKVIPTQAGMSIFKTLSEKLYYEYTKRSLTPEQFIHVGLQSWGAHEEQLLSIPVKNNTILYTHLLLILLTASQQDIDKDMWKEINCHFIVIFHHNTAAIKDFSGKIMSHL